MITAWLLGIELPIIIGGAGIAAWFAVDHQGRAATRAEEMRDLDRWLNAIRESR